MACLFSSHKPGSNTKQPSIKSLWSYTANRFAKPFHSMTPPLPLALQLLVELGSTPCSFRQSFPEMYGGNKAAMLASYVSAGTSERNVIASSV